MKNSSLENDVAVVMGPDCSEEVWGFMEAVCEAVAPELQHIYFGDGIVQVAYRPGPVVCVLSFNLGQDGRMLYQSNKPDRCGRVRTRSFDLAQPDSLQAIAVLVEEDRRDVRE